MNKETHRAQAIVTVGVVKAIIAKYRLPAQEVFELANKTMMELWEEQTEELDKYTCKKCFSRQWSEMDKNYMKLYGHCWGCDRRKWEAKEMTTEEFEAREEKALKTI